MSKFAWYAVNTHARAEEKARFNLERQGFKVFAPRYLKKRRHARKVDHVPAPLFPRYIFVGMEVEQVRWRAINSSFGVNHLVSNGNDPTPVPEAVIDAIRLRTDADGWVSLDQPLPYKKGEAVRITDGPMKDHEGLFDCADDNERIFILLDLLGRQVRVRMEAGSVSAAS